MLKSPKSMSRIVGANTLITSPLRIREGPLQRGESGFALAAVDDHVHPHFAGAHHIDVDPRLGERLKHANGDARVAPHADPGDRELCHLRRAIDSAAADSLCQSLSILDRALEIALRDREAN